MRIVLSTSGVEHSLCASRVHLICQWLFLSSSTAARPAAACPVHKDKCASHDSRYGASHPNRKRRDLSAPQQDAGISLQLVTGIFNVCLL